MLSPRANKKEKRTVAKCKLVFKHMSSRVVLRSRGCSEVAAHDKVLPAGFARAQAGRREQGRRHQRRQTDRQKAL